MSKRRGRLTNLESVIDGGGDITVGGIDPIPCAATAADDDQAYAMLLRRPSESLLELLERLDAAVSWAWEHEDRSTKSTH